MASSNKTDYEAVDEYITARMRADHIPGVALAIVKGDQIVYLKGYGRADQSGRPVTPQTPFLIGSITKTFTALAVMQLVEAGKVELDAPVQRYIPWFRVADPQASAQITVRMLIDQTSGLPQSPTLVTWTWPDEPDAIERHVRLLANVKLVFPPGQWLCLLQRQLRDPGDDRAGRVRAVLRGLCPAAYLHSARHAA